MRPYLQQAVRHAKAARRALVRGDLHEYELERERAFRRLAEAQVEFRQPYMEQASKAHSSGARGGRPRNEVRNAEWAEDLKLRKRLPQWRDNVEDLYDDIADRHNSAHPKARPVTGQDVRDGIDEHSKLEKRGK